MPGIEDGVAGVPSVIDNAGLPPAWYEPVPPQPGQRHPATDQLMRWFSWRHLPAGLGQRTSRSCAGLAAHMVDGLDDGPELTAGLRKLLEAKDCFVRAALDKEQS